MKRIYSNKNKLKALFAGLFLLGTLYTNAQCFSSFNFTLGSNGAVTFQSTSTGTSISSAYFWNFGSGNVLGASTITHTFTANGPQVVCLTMISSSIAPSCSATACQTVMISNAGTTPCNANFSAVTGPNGLVNFASTSTGTISGTIYSWTFGSTGFASGITATNTYSTNGYKPVCLTITNSVVAWCTSTKCDSVLITNLPTSTVTPCSASFSYVTGSNGSVNFVSTSTGTTSSSKYNWTFGGSATGTGSAPGHTFTSNGTKLVCLTLISDTTAPNSCTNTVCQSVVISNITTSTTPCNANFTSVLGANGLVNFASTSTGVTPGTSYSWNFGGSATGSGSVTGHTFTSNGTKIVCLTITNSVTSCVSTKCDTILISNVGGSVTPCAPTVVYTLTKDTTMALTWYSFPTYPSNITNATWSWGDGTYTTSLYPTHTYSAAGTYSTCVTVSVSCGTITATYCYVAGIFRSSETNDMITVNIKQAVPTGIKNQTSIADLINIYPNPNNGEFVLELNSVKELKTNAVLIYNIMGEKVFEKQILGNSKQTIDVSNLSSGTYFVKVSSESGSFNKKIVIQK